jgi:hypothetical protein
MIDQVGDRNRLTIGEDVVSTLGGAAAGPGPGVGPERLVPDDPRRGPASQV